jgi:hypothetical protein
VAGIVRAAAVQRSGRLLHADGGSIVERCGNGPAGRDADQHRAGGLRTERRCSAATRPCDPGWLHGSGE